MKIETRVETLRRVVAEDEGDGAVWVEAQDIEGPVVSTDVEFPLARESWEDFKRLGDAAWEAWDKTFGDKRPETMGVWRYGNESICASSVEFLPSAFVWYPGDKDYVGLAQKALDALKAEKPEWKLELREYTKSETSK